MRCHFSFEGPHHPSPELHPSVPCGVRAPTLTHGSLSTDGFLRVSSAFLGQEPSYFFSIFLRVHWHPTDPGLSQELTFDNQTNAIVLAKSVELPLQINKSKHRFYFASTMFTSVV